MVSRRDIRCAGTTPASEEIRSSVASGERAVITDRRFIHLPPHHDRGPQGRIDRQVDQPDSTLCSGADDR